MDVSVGLIGVHGPVHRSAASVAVSFGIGAGGERRVTDNRRMDGVVWRQLRGVATGEEDGAASMDRPQRGECDA